MPSWTLTWFQRDPNASLPTSQQTSPLWESFFWAFSNTTPQTSGISQGHHITESSVGFFACSFSCSHSSSPAPLANFFSLSSPSSLLSSILHPLVSCFWVRGRSRWDLWPVLTWHTMIPVFAVCVLHTPQSQGWTSTHHTNTHCIFIYFLLHFTVLNTQQVTHVEWVCICLPLIACALHYCWHFPKKRFLQWWGHSPYISYQPFV